MSVTRLLVLFVLLLVNTSLSAAVIKGVQSGTAVSSGNSVVSVGITGVDPAKSFLVFQTRSSSNRPPGSMIIGRLNAGGTAVEFVRTTTETSTIDIQWSVVEFLSGVSVQRGEVSQSSSTVNVSIVPVASTRQAFVLWSKVPAASHAIWSLDDPILGELTSTSNLQFRINSGSSGHRIAWQVVEFTNAADINVQKGSTSLLGSSASVDIALPTSVDVSKSFVLTGFRTAGSGADVGERMIRAQIIDSNTLRIDRSRTGDSLTEIVWQVVELKDGSSVQGGSESFPLGVTQRSVAITPVDTGRAVAFASVQAAAGQSLGRTAYNLDDIIGEASVTMGLSSAGIDLHRNSALGSADIGWFVVEFNGTPVVTPPTRVAEWHLDEMSWNGTAGEVTDASGNGNHGVRVGIAQTVANGKVCRAGAVVNEGSAINTGLDLDASVGSAGTVSFWFRPNWSDSGWERFRSRVLFDASLRSPAGNGASKFFKLIKRGGFSANSRLMFLFEDGADSDFFVSANVSRLTRDAWVHVGVTWDYTSNRFQIYFNGARVANNSRATNQVMPNLDSLYFGDNRSSYNFFGYTRVANGTFDEARIDKRVLTQAEIQADMNATYPCPGSLDHFVIGHDGAGINCVAETITVTATAADGSTVTTYTGSISLDTQATTGSWSLNTGGGSFVDAVTGDGLASYAFAAADAGVASFNLDYRSGPAGIDVDVFAGAIRDDDTEGNLVFSPSGFVITAAPLSNPPPAVIDQTIVAQTAASNFPLYIAAYGQTSTDPVCGIIEAYDGAKSIKFWSSYHDPVTGTLPVTVDSNTVAGSEAASAVQPVSFVQGQAAISVNYADVGDIDIAIKDDIIGNPSLPTGIRGVSQPFIVRPAGFVLSNIVRTGDGFANPVATDENDSVFIAAGSPFSVTATAINSLGNATPNYGRESIPESVLLTSTLVAAGGVNNPPLAFSTGFGSFVNGVATGSDFSWGEVGIISLTPSVGDGNYLGGGNVTGSTSGNIGRFTPFDFNVVLDNSPAFATACGSFTYLGQAFNYATAPQISISARNSTGSITQNYDNNWWKLADFSESYAHNGSLPATASLDVSGAGHVAISCNNCSGTVTTSFNGSLSYNTSTLEAVPFNGAVDIHFPITDSDGIGYAGNPFTISAIGFDAGSEQRSGRGFARDVYGTYANTGDVLSMPVGTQYYSAASTWLDNSVDNCTTYSYAKSDSGITTAVTPVSPVNVAAGKGDLAIQLSGDSGDPGGFASFTFTWPGWLTGSASATATFGIFRGDDRFLYWREAP